MTKKLERILDLRPKTLREVRGRDAGLDGKHTNVITAVPLLARARWASESTYPESGESALVAVFDELAHLDDDT